MKIKLWLIVVSLVCLSGCTGALISALTPNGGGSSGLTSLLVLLGLNRPSGGSSSGYSISSAFSYTSNPNGVWSYGWKSTATGTLTIYDSKWDSGFSKSWYYSSYGSFPNFSNNYASSGGVSPGETNMHPGSAGQISVLRWTAPQAGTISIKGSFKAGDTGAVDVYVLKNTTTLFSKTSTLITESYDQTTTVAIADTIDFQVGNAGNYTSDATPIDGVITYATADTVISVTLSPTAGHYNTPQYIQATSSPSTAKVYYTTDGTEPTESSTLYSKSIHIYGIAGKTLKFKAFSGGSSSTTVTAIYSYPPLKTGQTTSYVTGDDANLNQGVTRSYTDNGDGTILDNATGLVWQKCSRGRSGTTCAVGSATNLTWASANTYCDTRSLASKKWRLPTSAELITLTDFGRVPFVYLDPSFFPNTDYYRYWSVTIRVDITNYVWEVLPRGVMDHNLNSVAVDYVRCVSQ